MLKTPIFLSSLNAPYYFIYPSITRCYHNHIAAKVLADKHWFDAILYI